MHNIITPAIAKLLIQKYLEENAFVRSDIDSFNVFLDKGLQLIVDENKIIEPTIIPANVDSFRIRLDKIWAKNPEITEADGSKRTIFPTEARLRKLSYAAPIFIEISSHINDVQRETIQAQIGSMPIMLKSAHCNLSGMSREELVEKGEDPDDPGGYFIINGTERVLVKIEDLASNTMLTEEQTKNKKDYTTKIFSESGSYKIPHTLERTKEGIFNITFTRAKKIPVILIIKALGITKDEEIMNSVSKEEQYDEILVNLFEYAHIKNADDAIEEIAKAMNMVQTKEIRAERVSELLDKYLLPHVGIGKQARVQKAYNLCKLVKRNLLTIHGKTGEDDKDHYMNKRLKLSGDLLSDLFRVNLKILVGDILYNFQRMVKRGKFPSLRTLVREKLLKSRIYTAMATGAWVGGRKGISQRIQRLNHLNTLSHLQRIVSPLSASQENFEARELHPTHLGRVCPVETPEGTNIGLRKNLAMLASISGETPEEEVLTVLKNAGMKIITIEERGAK